METEITDIQIMEQIVRAKKDAIDAKHRELLAQKAALEAVVLRDQQEKERIRMIHDEIQALETLKSKDSLGMNASTEIVLASQMDASLRDLNDRELEGLLALARRRQKMRENYINLAALLVFFAFYSSMLITQRDQTAAFDVESR